MQYFRGGYGITPEYILDNHLYKYNSDIKPLNYLKNINCTDYILILACTNLAIYMELKNSVLEYINESNISELESMKTKVPEEGTKCGKYSSGPLCNHWLVEEVGAFSCSAGGCDVVDNHATEYISTHPFIYYDQQVNPVLIGTYEDYRDRKWYFEGISPKGTVKNLKRIRIGNDVWLGRNVIVTNGVNIGNGVIAGAGSVITKDVPDYAVVVGCPARIIRYRYNKEQIAALNRIEWWNWSDDEIRERYNDFFLPIEEFIEKYDY